jgi:hypothetical protein
MGRAPLAALILLLTGASAALPAAEPPTDCDVLASNPEDPDRRAQAVPREKMDLPKAIAVCEAQVKRDPKDLRALYQLARSLLYAGETARGVPLMKQAADAGDRQAQFVYGLLVDRARPDAPRDICIAETYWLQSARKGARRRVSPTSTTCCAGGSKTAKCRCRGTRCARSSLRRARKPRTITKEFSSRTCWRSSIACRRHDSCLANSLSDR